MKRRGDLAPRFFDPAGIGESVFSDGGRMNELQMQAVERAG
jgi:hypothetical protein